MYMLHITSMVPKPYKHLDLRVYMYMKPTCVSVVNMYDCKHIVHASNNIYELALFLFHDCMITQQALDLFNR